jgi:cyclic beta-1,2-glucan synthetase
MKYLSKKLKDDLSLLRDAYRKTLYYEGTDNSFEWLSDNYHILEREGRSILKELRHSVKGKELSGVFSLCREICTGGILPGAETIKDDLKDKELSVAESEMLPLIFRAALLSYAADSWRRRLKVIPKTARRSSGVYTEPLIQVEDESINAIKSLRRIQDIDFSLLIEEISPVERILSDDPAGIYKQMDEETRARYRRAAAKMAARDNISEIKAAEQAIENAKNADERFRHVGFHLDIIKRKDKKRGFALIMMEPLLSFALCLVLLALTRRWYVPILLFLPMWEIVKVITDLAARQRHSHFMLPRMELEGVIPDEARTLITISTLLPSAEKAKELSKHLSQLYRTNKSGAVTICVLADLKGAKTPTTSTDESDIEASKRVIDKLNQKYGGGFILAVRPRIFSPTQNEYTGRERKRGAITALVCAIKGESDEFLCLYGDTENLNKTKYIMALDADTSMPLDTLSELVSAALHPLNKPVIDEGRRIVTEGYGIFAPRVVTDIASAAKTSFARLMTGTGGITAYNAVCADRYQDMFGDSIFMGKGLIDVDVFSDLLKDRFPSERVLSHDILEGLFMRTALMGDVELTDSFPSNQLSYFDRLHRWIRGDWQNLRYCLPKTKKDGIKQKNPYDVIARYKVFDNLRRSATPVFAALGCILALFMPPTAAAITTVLCLVSAGAGELFAGINSIVSGGFSMLSRLYYSSAIPDALASFIRSFISASMLVQTGWTSLNAISKALFRQLVSKKKLLEWVPAAQNDKSKGAVKVIKRCLPSIIVGALLIIFDGPFSHLAGLLFIFNVLFAVFSGREKRAAAPLPDSEDKEKMKAMAASIWKFYDSFCRASDNFLPPDNIQETPVHRTAHRTSPTNIGLLLCCILAARDLSFIDTKTMCQRISNTLDTIDKLEKWHGNLLNWYDTQTLKPLHPKYASSVDSGNFICCLVALRQGLLEYAHEDSAASQLAERIGNIIDSTDISVFFNRQRKLFHIGFDLDSGEMSNSYYDILMSESRMTSYYAVASRIVPKKHWGVLGRTLAKSGRYTGLISWTGTMFEYFMPHLFIPVYSGTLVSEALRFCLWCQKERTRKSGLPYGVSESGFYAFDPQLNYQYKAHGVQKLGIKRMLNADLVVSPYSTFLTLPFDRSAAMKNLAALEKLQIVGRCGFYEAADFTPERTQGQDYSVVRSYMAHHLGMSMLSILNALNGNIFQKRFMRDEKMAAGQCLLEEKIPSGAVVFNDVQQRDIPSRPERIVPTNKRIDEINPLYPECRLFSNGEWTSIIADTGSSASLYRGADITRRGSDVRNPGGIFAFLKTSKGDCLPFTVSPQMNADGSFKARLSPYSAELSAQNEFAECTMTVSVHPRIPAERRRFTIKNTGKNPLKGELFIYFEPSLNSHISESSHPAFSKLFLKSYYNRQEKVLLFERRGRSGEPLCLAAGFIEGKRFSFDTRREYVLERPFGLESLRRSGIRLENRTGGIDSCAAFSVPVSLPPRSTDSVTLVLSAASTNQEALERFLKVRAENLPITKGATSPFNETGLDGVGAARLLSSVFFRRHLTKDAKTALQGLNSGVKALWSIGVSGDNPVITVTAERHEDLTNAIPFIRMHKKLSLCGIPTTLVILIKENEGYEARNIQTIRNILRKENYEQALGSGAGIIPVNMNTAGETALRALKAAAVLSYPESAVLSKQVKESIKMLPILPSTLPENAERRNRFENGGYVIADKPPLPWCFVLSNEKFGTLLSDTALGYTWAINANLNKLTPWVNDTMRDNRGEMLILKADEGLYDLVLGSEAFFRADAVRYRGRAAGLTHEIKVYIEKDKTAKVVEVEMENPSNDARTVQLAYYIKPIMGQDGSDNIFLKTSPLTDGVKISSPDDAEYPGVLNLLSETVQSVCIDDTSFFAGRWNTDTDQPSPHICGAVIRQIILPPRSKEKVKFILSWRSIMDYDEEYFDMPEHSLVTNYEKPVIIEGVHAYYKEPAESISDNEIFEGVPSFLDELNSKGRALLRRDEAAAEQNTITESPYQNPVIAPQDMSLSDERRLTDESDTQPKPRKESEDTSGKAVIDAKPVESISDNEVFEGEPSLQEELNTKGKELLQRDEAAAEQNTITESPYKNPVIAPEDISHSEEKRLTEKKEKKADYEDEDEIQGFVRPLIRLRSTKKMNLTELASELHADTGILQNQNRIIIETPDTALNNIFNDFLLWQILNVRLLGRTGFYQCGGAYGFRDQLQDCSALVLTHPEIVRRQIIRSAAAQFPEGDVLHWWHTNPAKGFSIKGVRTRYSDDLLWLPYVTAEYVLKTGDYDFLKTKVPFVDGPLLSESEHERYFEPVRSYETATIEEHCKRAIERSSARGAHDLPLMGGGDWNDSFNLVGIKGQGESVWLAQFLSMTLNLFAEVLEKTGDENTAKRYRSEASKLHWAIDEHAWNGSWYLRAFYDDGTQMGARGNPECEIDLLPQSFAVLSSMPDKERIDTALKAAAQKLVDERAGIIKLFTPAFTHTGRQTGYVNAYPQGVRENGGQYTHAAVWFCLALFKNYQPDEAYRLLRMINPAAKYENNEMAARYKTEPYAFAGDVYSAKGLEGRGGWSLYTGAAGWYYRTVYEEMLGIKQRDGKITVEPKLPENFGPCKLRLILDGEEKTFKL